jgi:hypothetical protein
MWRPVPGELHLHDATRHVMPVNCRAWQWKHVGSRVLKIWHAPSMQGMQVPINGTACVQVRPPDTDSPKHPYCDGMVGGWRPCPVWNAAHWRHR